VINFNGKNILIIGGSTGIGYSLINSLLEAGGNVYKASRHLPDELKDKVNYLPYDVLDPSSSLSELPEQLHGVVYGVGSITLKPFQSLTTEDFIHDYNLNVIGAVKVLKAAFRPLKAAGGSSVVLISTVAANIGLNYHTSIAAAKGAIQGLGKSLAAEWAKSLIRVNVVAPSLTDTPLAGNLLSTEDKIDSSNKRHPLGRIGKPEDIASAIQFLLSVDSSWVTGQIIGIDGGLGSLKPL
jgi:NAD(P)-dependent dehydrogenase (short-subunit alcohol dehydrogenase family)